MPQKSHAPALPSDEHALTIDERTNFCFGCGPDNPEGLHLTFLLHAEDPLNITATAAVNLTRRHEGPPGYIHGGIIATLLDEAMSKLNRPLNLLALTRHMDLDYLRPAPLHTRLTLTARHLRREGRKLFHTAQLASPGGSPLARANGIFIIIDPAIAAAHLAAQNPNT